MNIKRQNLGHPKYPIIWARGRKQYSTWPLPQILNQQPGSKPMRFIFIFSCLNIIRHSLSSTYYVLSLVLGTLTEHISILLGLSKVVLSSSWCVSAHITTEPHNNSVWKGILGYHWLHLLQTRILMLRDIQGLDQGPLARTETGRRVLCPHSMLFFSCYRVLDWAEHQ